MFSRNDLKLYVITDRGLLHGRTLENAVEQALQGGATMVQLREKHVTDAEYIARAERVKMVCDQYHVPLIVNDNVQVAIMVGAAGVHLGASDGDLKQARALLGRDMILGATARTAESARAAQAAGAEYIGCGAVFGTATKVDAETISLAQFRQVVQAVSIPVVAIGGVNAQNATELQNTGAAGVCAISSVFGAADIRQAAQALRAVCDEVII